MNPNNTHNNRPHNNGSRHKGPAVASLVPDVASYNDFCQQCVELGDALDTIHGILSSNPLTSDKVLTLKQRTSVVLPTKPAHFHNHPEAKSNITLAPLKLVYFGEYGLLVLIYAPLDPHTTPAAHNWLSTVLLGSALISNKLIRNSIIIPMERWCAEEVTNFSTVGEKRPRDGEDEDQGNVDPSKVTSNSTLEAHLKECRTKHLYETILQPLKGEMLEQHDYLLYSVIGAVNTSHVGKRGEAAMREYMTRWKLATRGAFPIPSSSRPITSKNYEEVILNLQAGCPDLDDECIEWPVHGPSHPFVCQVQFLGKAFLASEFSQ